MKYTPFFSALVTLIISIACTNNQSGSEAAAHSDSLVIDSALYLKASQQITDIVTDLEQKRSDIQLFIKEITVEQAYGNVSFYGGKVVAATWQTDPYEPEVSVYFDDNEEVMMFSLLSKGSDYFSELFYFKTEDDLVILEKSGYFGEENYPLKMAPRQNWASEYLNSGIGVEFMGQLFHATAVRQATSSQGTCYYKGTINKTMPIWLRFNRKGDWATGDYRYAKGTSSLSITADFKQNNLVLTEKVGDEVTGKFTGTIEVNGNISGKWKSADGKRVFPFELQRTNKFELENGEVLFTVQNSNPVWSSLVLDLDATRIPAAVEEELEGLFNVRPLQVLWSGMPSMIKLDSFLMEVAFFQERTKAWNLDHQGRNIQQRYFASIYNALPEAFKNRHLGYYSAEQDNYEREERLLAAAIYCTDRSEANIERWWEHFGNNWTELVLKGYFTSFDTTANQLLNAYEHLIAQDAIERKMQDVYAAIDSMDQQKDNNLPGAVKYVGALEDHRTFLKDLMPPQQEDHLWAYSFWMRRFHEENHKSVYNILKEAYTTVITAQHEYD